METLSHGAPQPYTRPNTRRINGHRLYPMVGMYGYIYWVIRPNHSDFSFCFNKLSCAEAFAKRYANTHGTKFWYRIWTSNPIWHFTQCQEMLTDLSHML